MIERRTCSGSDQIFSNTQSVRGLLSDRRKHEPKPDFWLGLRILSKEDLFGLKGSECEEEAVKYFRQDLLEKLSNTWREFDYYRPIKSIESAGFPCFIVEFKPELECISKSRMAEEVLAQAANGCHVCLKLNERLAEVAKEKPHPVVTITSAGPIVKIFVAYATTGNDGRRIYVR